MSMCVSMNVIASLSASVTETGSVCQSESGLEVVPRS